MAAPINGTYRGWHYDVANDRGTIRLHTSTATSEYFRIETGQHVLLNSITDGKNVRINSRNVTQTSGDHSGVQIKPNQTVATASITALETSPRFASGIAGTNLVAIKADPVLKGTTGNVGGQVVGVQVNIDFGISGSRTITGDIAAFEAFLAVPSSGMTYSALVAVMRVRTVNVRAWDGLFNFDDANTGAASATADGMFKDPEGDQEAGFLTIHIGSTKYEIPIYASS